MADLFGEWIPTKWINDVLKTVRECSRHTFIFLTKNPSCYWGFNFPGNCWLGATTDTRTNATTFIDNLAFMKNNKTFISAEPLLEDISINVENIIASWNCRVVDWIIIGALNSSNVPVPVSKGGTRREWVKNLILSAQRFKVPLFIKDSLLDMARTMCDDKHELDLPKFRQLPYLPGGSDLI